jgi:ABC-type antimicrobial peptide transport system permease subunit
MQLDDVLPLTAAYDVMRAQERPAAWTLALVTTSVLLLSAAGIYALMSFTVAYRTREIGIRAALGANPRRLLVNVFAPVLRQLALGVLVGSLLSAGMLSATTLTASDATYLLAAVAIIMLVVGLMAAVGPARRSLRIQPSDALRADA